MINTVIKRDGTEEPFDPQKLNNWAQWSEKTINPKDFNWSGIVMRTVGALPEKVSAKELQEALIRECLNQNSWEGSRMAGRLYASSLSKELYESRKHPHIKDLHKSLADKGVIVFPNYTEEEYEEINKMINHKRDFIYSHYAINQLVSKYSLQDRVNRTPFETPQFSYMRVAMGALNNYNRDDKLQKLKELYDEISLQRVVVPTPYFANSLTINPSVSSCSVFTCSDTSESIGVLNTLAYTLTTAGAGVGAHMKTRSINDSVRGGLVRHAGKVPYYRAFANVMKSSTQGCYTGNTQVLTERGWVYFENIIEDDLLAQVHDDCTISYIKPLKLFKYDNKGKLYHFKGLKTSLKITANHRMILVTSEGFSECTAEEYFNSGCKLPIASSVSINDNSITYEEDKILSSTVIFEYFDKVYCAEVETGKLIVKDEHTGFISVCGNSRSGASTMHFPFFDPEVEVLIGLKNPMSTLANRVRESDYAVSINKLLLKRALTNKDTYLFSYKDNPELYEKFYHKDSEVFDKELEEFALNYPDKVTTIKAKELLSAIVKHRVETGRLYIHFADLANSHTPEKGTIYSSNLCMEIELSTKPFPNHLDLYSETPEGRVAFCNLAGINLVNVKTDEEYERAAYYSLFLIDRGIDNSSFVFPALNANLKEYRNAGVGVNGLAYQMAKHRLSYSSQDGRDFIFEMAEKHGYFLTKAAIKLTEEYGVCAKAHMSKYSEGWLPIDFAPKASFELSTKGLQYDWETLRKKLIGLKGLRFSTLSCIMPAESSSIAVSSTNGIYPIRSLSLVKSSGDTTNKWYAPESTALANKYEIVWDIPNEDLIKMYGIYQIFIDQGISADTFVDRSKVVDISVASIFKELTLCAKYGIKSLYYLNSKIDKEDAFKFLKENTDDTDKVQDSEEVGCESGGCTL